MQKFIFSVLIGAAVCATGCSKPSPPKSSPSTAPAAAAPAPEKNDAVHQKLAEFAGSGATDCGRLSSQADDALKSASTCAMDAAQAKHPFYVAYDMPGMTVGVAGSAEGKLFTVQAQGSDVSGGACPSQLRLAPSGRVTCFAPGDTGSMGMGVHNGMSAPSGMANPHAGGGTTGAPPKHF
ncbi:MAG TPA: hypothetical protein VJQ82_13990 [Terriglobales bacterium]|nr:hypothetical protein [Terriglobales bacterium]